MIIRGADDSERLIGGAGEDSIDGNGGDDLIFGKSGDDHLTGGIGDDRILGGIGRDVILGGPGEDLLRGDAGDDVIYGGTFDDRAIGGDGLDRLYGKEGDDVLAGLDGDDSLFGEDGDDRLLGGQGDDLMAGGLGDDNMLAVAGDDYLTGGGGRDRLLGGQGDDYLNGGSGDDRLVGNLGQDILLGEDGNDSLDGGVDADNLYGGADDDVLQGGQGEDLLSGGSGADKLNGGGNDDRIEGGRGDDLIRGGFGNDIIYGDDGADTILAGRGDDVIMPGEGLDYILGEDGDDIVILESDLYYGGHGPNLFIGGRGQDTIVFTDALEDLSVTLDQRGFMTLSPRNPSTSEARLAPDVEFIIANGETYSFDQIAGMASSSIWLSEVDRYWGDTVENGAGAAGAGAGDVNGDGFDDLIFGAPGDGTGAELAGGAFVIYGRPGDLPQELNKEALPARDGFFVQSDVKYDLAGQTLSSAGDINGDGYDDLIVGAPLSQDLNFEAGKALIIFGGLGNGDSSGAGLPVVDAASLSANEGFIIFGQDYQRVQLSETVTGLGDINGDGLDDIGLGTRSVYSLEGSGEAYVIFGCTNGFGETVTSSEGAARQVLDVETLAPEDGLVIKSIGSSLPDAISGGDINGDGFTDILVSNYTGGYVIFGSDQPIGALDPAGRQVINVDTLSADQGFAILPADDGDELGEYLSVAGDVNGDGINDLIISAPMNSTAYHYGGRAYVVFGSRADFGGTVDLASLQAEDGFIMQSQEEDKLGPVSSAGDINGDGFDDLLVGAGTPSFADHGAYIVFGGLDGQGELTADGQQILDLLKLSPDEGVIVRNDVGTPLSGVEVAAAGDVDNDGFDDILLRAELSVSDYEFYVIHGAADLTEQGLAGAAQSLDEAEAVRIMADLEHAFPGGAAGADGGGDDQSAAPHGGASAPPPEAEMANFSDVMEATLARQLDEISGRLDDAFNASGADVFSAGDGFGWL